uniref:SnoaL-like domain-containing protein n=1 Tax=Caenorhabditis tropicalis TaxID=1561998 RepID=A0A1I7URA5_9PELO
MRLLLLATLPALLIAFRPFMGGEPPEDLTQDKTTFKEFATFYVKLFEDMMKTKTAETFQAHINYIDVQMMFNECNAPQYENLAMYIHWLRQFVAYHDDPIIKIMDLRGDNEKGEMLLNVDVQAQYKYRQNFDMKISALNDDGIGWKVLFVDRSIGCHK